MVRTTLGLFASRCSPVARPARAASEGGPRWPRHSAGSLRRHSCRRAMPGRAGRTGEPIRPFPDRMSIGGAAPRLVQWPPALDRATQCNQSRPLTSNESGITGLARSGSIARGKKTLGSAWQHRTSSAFLPESPARGAGRRTPPARDGISASFSRTAAITVKPCGTARAGAASCAQCSSACSVSTPCSARATIRRTRSPSFRRGDRQQNLLR